MLGARKTVRSYLQLSRDEAECTCNHKDLIHVLGYNATSCLFVCVCVCRVMEEKEDRRQQIVMEVRVKREKSEEILKERENVVRKVFMPAYDQLYTCQVIVVI